jgi:hypothetical protein
MSSHYSAPIHCLIPLTYRTELIVCYLNVAYFFTPIFLRRGYKIWVISVDK